MPTLLEKRAALLKQASAITKAASDVDLTDAQLTEVEGLLSQADELEAEHKKAERQARARQGVHAGVTGLGVSQGRVTREVPNGDGPLLDEPARTALLDDPKKGYASPRAFLMDVMAFGRRGPAAATDPLKAIMAAAGSDEQSTFDDGYGGILLPEAFSPNIMEIAAEADPIASLVTRVPMTTQIIKLPARVDKDHSTSVSGGLRVYRRAEAKDVASSRMELEGVRLEAMALMGVSYATEELLSRSPVSFASLLDAGFRTEFNSRILRERLTGQGGGEFLGAMNSGCLISVAKEVGQGADTIVGQNVLKMRKQCWGYGGAVWLANHDTYDQLAALHIAGTNGDRFLFAPGNGVDVPDTLLGRPIFFTEYAQTLGDKGDLFLGVWSQFLEGTLTPMGSAESIHVRFENHERAFKFWTENAGAPWWKTALTPKNSSLKLSPFVALDARP